MRGHIQEREVKRRTANTPKSFRLWVDLPRDPISGKRRQKTRTVRGTRKQAEQELRSLIREVERGAHVHSNGLTVADLLKRWLQDYARANVAARLLCLALASLLVTACAETVVESPATESPAIGHQIAFTGDYEIYVMDADGGNVRRLTGGKGAASPADAGRGRNRSPVWLPVP